MIIGHKLRTSVLAALLIGLAACSGTGGSSGMTSSGQSGSTNQSGMNQPGMGQMDHAQMMQHCRDMMKGGGMAEGSGSMGAGGMSRMDHAQMMQHCQSMMAQPSQGGTPATK